MGIAGPYLAGKEQASAARSASAAQERAAQLTVDETRRQFDVTRADQAPWLATGRSALNQLAEMYGLGGDGGSPGGPGSVGPDGRPIDPRTGLPMGVGVGGGGGGSGGLNLSSFLASPDYQFALDQGLQATQRSAAAGGNLRSGNTLAALTQYGQGLASQQLGNYTNRLASLAGVGQQSANTLGVLGANAATNIGNAYTNAGNARASGLLAAGAARANFYNQADSTASQLGSMLLFRGFGAGAGAAAGASTVGAGNLGMLGYGRG